MSLMQNVVQYFSKSVIVSDQTKEGITSILRMWLHISNILSDIETGLPAIDELIDICFDDDEFSTLLEEFMDIIFQPSVISSNGLELIFSILRHKIPNLNCMELCQQLRKSIEIRNIFHLTDEVRRFSLPEFDVSLQQNANNISKLTTKARQQIAED
ncbi:hypothetical protein FDP41_010516 [Naegleria fowleri]|uniref:Uncharacterized protein n=1 Tax=Naegleria fowleri TaxID=5763 RepID=A0A6A5C8I5_NAEFO|nr:uncharacterized protein FDP41_010516 [Naegleria fowleri]KAF0983451.1 hypothetical protein FDP41_010516 [Naegleria fowleri]CAG4715252.1 unnamed protein product [Naegleria fowleri]